MMNTSRTIFISDLHLDENHPQIAQIFFQFLSSLDKKSIDAVYILGDLFEAWIGDDNNISFNKKIIQALKSVTQKDIPVYFLCGNRDFLIGKRFINETGCQLIFDETKINVYGHSVLVMHGDTLCTRDISYLNARKKLRNKFLQKLFLWLPLNLRIKIANNMRDKSMKHTSTVDAEIMDVTQTEVEKIMNQHQVEILIHGHTHKPGIHTFELNNKSVTRIVLGAWHTSGNMLVWDVNDNKKLIEFF